MKKFLDRYFSITDKKSTFKTEILAGLTTFITMAYIIFVNPSILEVSGIPKEAAIAATLWSAALCTLAMGLFAKLPYAVAPGMGINAFFSFYVCKTVGLSWQTALGAVFISGIVFLILTLTKLREKIIESVPLSLKSAIVVGIGMFIAFVGFQSSGIVANSDATLVTLGHLSDPKVMLTLFGVAFIAVLLYLKVKAAMLIGIIATAIIGMVFNITPAPNSVRDVVSFTIPSLKETFLEMDIVGAVKYGIVSIIFTFTVVELFDNIGTLIGLSKSSGLMSFEGKIENVDKALLTDSTGTMLSAALGTCTVTTYIESSSGIQAGGRTGLTAVTVAVCFLLSFIFTPLAAIIPAFATAPVLIIVGALMLSHIKNIDFNDLSEVIPSFLIIIMMPLTYSIAIGFGMGFTCYCLMKIFSGKIRQISPVMWFVSIIFIISFINHG